MFQKYWFIYFLCFLFACQTESKKLLPAKTDSLTINYANSQKVNGDSSSPCNSKQKFVRHYRTWKTLDLQKKFAGFSQISSESACQAEQFRENMPYPNQKSKYWQLVYSSLLENNTPYLNKMCDLFESIGKKQNLDYDTFVEMVMTFVQEIPYILVHPNDCDRDANNNKFSYQYHATGKKCLPNKKFGLQSPAEFMFNLKGDCDTRALFAYCILAHFGYDVAILGSSRHAMLGINMLGQGNYLMQNGKKYYFWETTGKGWLIGGIPPEYQSDDWEITLINKQKS